MIDEASRQRFIYPYREQSSYSTIDFVKRAIAYFGYKLKSSKLIMVLNLHIPEIVAVYIRLIAFVKA